MFITSGTAQLYFWRPLWFSALGSRLVRLMVAPALIKACTPTFTFTSHLSCIKTQDMKVTSLDLFIHSCLFGKVLLFTTTVVIDE